MSFFIDFVFSFPALSSFPQYLCIDFSLCLFINVYKAFREPRGKKVSKYLVEEELKHWTALFLLTLGSISCCVESCSQDVVLLGWGWLKQAKSSCSPTTATTAQENRTLKSMTIYSLSKPNTQGNDTGSKHTLFHIYSLLWAMNLFSHETLNCLLLVFLPTHWVKSSWWNKSGDVIKPINTLIGAIMLFIREMKPMKVFI